MYKPGARRDGGQTLPQLPEGTSPAHSLISDFWPPGLGESTVLLFYAPRLVALPDGHSRTLVGFAFSR